MPNPCELVEDYVATLADTGPDAYTVSLVSSADIESGPYGVIDGDVTEGFNAAASVLTNVISYDVAESFAVSAGKLPTFRTLGGHHRVRRVDLEQLLPPR